MIKNLDQAIEKSYQIIKEFKDVDLKTKDSLS